MTMLYHDATTGIDEDACFVVLRGAVVVTLRHDDGSLGYRELSPGDICYEGCLYARHPSVSAPPSAPHLATSN